jgi:hypothetical protein
MWLGKLSALRPESAIFWDQRFSFSTLLPCFASVFAYPEHDTSGSVGRFLPNLDVKLLDGAGADITAFDVRGELAIRGLTAMPGCLGCAREADLNAGGVVLY